jgi:4-aminobutyrate aminotransferase-like enzyme
MAPHAEDNFVSSTVSTKKAVEYVPPLYRDIDVQAYKDAAKEYLAWIGIPFQEGIITGSKGLYCFTADGRKILDWTSGQMSCLIGHGNPEIVSVMNEYANNLDHLFSGMISPPVISLAQRLASVLPKPLSKTLFLSTGGESNEAAIKMAKIYTGKFEIVGLGASWHGLTAQALSAQYFHGRRGQGPLMPGTHQLPPPNAYRSVFRNPDGSYDWEAELNYGWDMIDRASCGSLAACIVECIQSAGGMHVLPAGYLTALKKHCELRDMLLIIDEAQTGLGRTGDMFAFNHEGVVPDILTLSKTLGNGIPLSAVVTTPEIDRVCRERDFIFVTTHVNDPLPAAVGDKVLEIVLRDNLVENSRALGLYLQEGLKKLQSRYGCVGDIRGRGLMAGMEIVGDPVTKAPSPKLAQALADKVYQLGLWANLSSQPISGGAFRIAPPITSTREEIDAGLEILENALASTEGSLRLY